MKHENLVLCGGLLLEGELNEIYCDTETGELCFTLGDTGVSYMIGEVTVTDPVKLPSVASLRQVIEDNKLVGMVYTKKNALAILTEYAAEWRPLGAMSVATNQSFSIDTMIEAEIED